MVEQPDYEMLPIDKVIANAESAYGANLIKLDVQVIKVDRENVDENYEKGNNQ